MIVGLVTQCLDCRARRTGVWSRQRTGGSVPMKWTAALVLGIGLVSLSRVVPASADSTSQDVAYGTGSVLTTLVYAPLKASFCILGGITSGFTLPFAGPDTAG